MKARSAPDDIVGHRSRRALVTGATGYVGSRLVPRLLEEGWQVRILTRRAESVRQRAWFGRVETIEGDVANSADLETALGGIDSAWYLVHSMDGKGDFAERDRALAQGFGRAAAALAVKRIVYLSGLHPAGDLSAHLASRVEVGEELMRCGVPTAVLQAAVIVGSGSASFEMMRHLTNRLPAMIAPRWLDNRIQPIAIADVLDLLVAAADLPPEANRTYDIGGPDVLTYREMIHRYARAAGRSRRLILTLPVLTPRLASLWVGTVTPVPTGIARPLIDSLVHEVIVKENDLLDWLGRRPTDLVSFDAAVLAALQRGRRTEPGSGVGALPEPGEAEPGRLTAADPTWAGDR